LFDEPDNQIGDAGATALAPALKEMKGLKELYLAGKCVIGWWSQTTVSNGTPTQPPRVVGLVCMVQHHPDPTSNPDSGLGSEVSELKLAGLRLGLGIQVGLGLGFRVKVEVRVGVTATVTVTVTVELCLGLGLDLGLGFGLRFGLRLGVRS